MIRLSVIIPTRNRSALLEEMLRSLLTQKLPLDSFEVIIVDNGSTDNTKSVAEKYSKSLRHFKYILEMKPGLHEGRHAGLRAANGQILVYTDDDTQAFPEWLDGIHDAFQNEHVGLVGGKAIPLYESGPPEWLELLWEKTPYGKVLPYLSLLDFGDEIKEVSPDFIFGCNFSIRKELLIRIGGFHPDGMPEALLRFRGDGETFVANEVKRMGYKTLYNHKASVWHRVPAERMTRDYLKKRLFMFGIAGSYAAARATPDNPTKPRTLPDKLKRFKRLLMTRGIHKELLRSYYQGYDFHQSEMGKDKDLIAWVLKPNYLGADLQ